MSRGGGHAAGGEGSVVPKPELMDGSVVVVGVDSGMGVGLGATAGAGLGFGFAFLRGAFLLAIRLAFFLAPFFAFFARFLATVSTGLSTIDVLLISNVARLQRFCAFAAYVATRAVEPELIQSGDSAS